MNFFALHEWFYKAILTQINSVPIQSLWLAFFTKIPVFSANNVKKYENGSVSEWFFAPNALISTGTSVMGMLVAQGVQIPGEGFGVSRIGPENSGGVVKGAIGGQRQDPQELSISFLETNFSFTDLVLRPWTIMASHKSLKSSTYKTAINVINLAKTGPGNMLMPRTHWIFHGACPISIDQQEYTYGADQVKTRQVSFAYNYYTMQSIGVIIPEQFGGFGIPWKDETDFELIQVPKGAAGHGSSKTVKIEKGSVNSSDVSFQEKKTKEDAPINSTNLAFQEVITDPNDYANHVIQAGRDLLNGGGEVLVTNLDRVVNDAADVLRMKAEELLPDPDDTPTFTTIRDPKGMPPALAQKGKETTVVAGPNNNVETENVGRYQTGMGAVEGAATDVVAGIMDTPLFVPGLYGQNVKIPEADYMRNKPQEDQLNPSNPNNDTVNQASLNYQHEDVPNAAATSSNVKLQIVDINEADTASSSDIKFQEKKPVNKDYASGREISNQEKGIKSNDNIKKGNIPHQSVTVNRNDVLKKENAITLQIVDIKSDDYRRKGPITYQEYKVPQTDRREKGPIPYQQVDINTIDRTTSVSHIAQIKRINEDDYTKYSSSTNKNNKIVFQEVKIKEDDKIVRSITK